jgi:predicted RNA-binding Zn-ribbon protein involved in translation (DUF1610 family)
MKSADFITLACPSCGGSLNITPDIERFACAFCGKSHLVRRQGGIISISPIVERLDRIASSSDQQAAELAINRLEQAARRLRDQISKLEKKVVKCEVQLGQLTLVTIILSVVVFGAGAVVLMYVLPSLKYSTVIGFVVAAVVGAGVFMYVVVTYRRQQKVEIARLSDEIRPLRQKLSQCNTELCQHYATVGDPRM